jgi:hypothetical protein
MGLFFTEYKAAPRIETKSPEPEPGRGLEVDSR